MTALDLFLVAGQSNAGQAGGDSGTTPSVPVGHGYSITDVVSDALPGLDRMAWPSFINAMYAATSTPVGIVRTVVGGTALRVEADTGNGNWSPSGSLRSTAVTNTLIAIDALITAGFEPTLRGVVWVQGERDATSTGGTRSDYAPALSVLVNYFQSSLGVSNLPMYVIRTGALDDGTFAAQFAEIRSLQDAVAASDADILMAYTGTVDFPGLGWMFDNVHYSQAGKNALGAAAGTFVAANLRTPGVVPVTTDLLYRGATGFVPANNYLRTTTGFPFRYVPPDLTPPTVKLLREATLWLDATYAQPGEQTALNRGTGGSALNAKYGSVNTGARIVGGAAVLPGTAGNYLSTPDAAALDIVGDIDIRCKVALPDWTPGAIQTLVAKYSTTGNQRQYWFRVDTTGGLYFGWTPDGITTTGHAAVSTVAVAAADGATKWVRATLDVDNGAAGRDVKFWTSDDGTTWTQLGTTVTQAGVTSIFSGTAVLGIGARIGGVGDYATGTFYAAQIRDGIDGTVVFDLDLTDVPDDSRYFRDATGKVVTVDSTSFDTNDPVLLRHTGTNYAYVPITASNYLSTPDAAALDITGDIEMVARIKPDAWASGNFATIVSKWSTSLSYLWRITAAGAMEIHWSPDGTASSFHSSTVALQSVVGPNDIAWLRVTLDVDNGAAGRTVKFWYSLQNTTTEPTVWTQLGTDRTSAPVTSIFAGTSAMHVGAGGTGSSQLFAGAIYRAIVRNGIDGATVFDFNAATDIPSSAATSLTATSGQTVTVFRSTSGRKTALVTRPVWLFGTDDFLAVADNALLDMGAGDSFTAIAVVRQWATPLANGRFVDKSNTVDTGWSLRNNGTAFSVIASIDDGPIQVSRTGLSTFAAGALTLLGIEVDRTAELLTSFANNSVSAGAATGTVGSLANTHPLAIGRNATGSGYSEFELVAVAVWRRVLTTDEIAAINTHYGTV